MGTRTLRSIAIGAAALAAVAVIGFGLHGIRGQGIATGDQPAAIRVKQVEGETRLLVPKEALVAGGIAVAAVKATEFQERVAALATIVAPQTLFDQRRAYQTAAAEAARGELAARAARLEVQRLQRLHRDDRIVSDKSLETAQVAAATEETNFRLASSQLSLQGGALSQQWGSALSADLKNGSPRLEGLLSGRDTLVQVAVPAGRHLPTPATVEIEASSEDSLVATVISGVPHADPKFQAQGFYAVAPADARLLPGMTIPASVPIGPPAKGVEVPEEAVVRWQGKAYVFIATQGEFARRPIATDIATPKGWLVRNGLPDGSEIVVRGAQLLLSEEMKTGSGAGDKP